VEQPLLLSNGMSDVLERGNIYSNTSVDLSTVVNSASFRTALFECGIQYE